jgi:hypothetical protein
MDYDPKANPIPLYDAVNRRLDDAIRLQKRIIYLERLKLLDRETKRKMEKTKKWEVG